MEALCSAFDCCHDRFLLVVSGSSCTSVDLGSLDGTVQFQGDRYGVSTGRISQIRGSALRKLREGPEGEWLKSWRPASEAAFCCSPVWYWNDLLKKYLVAEHFAEEISHLVLGRDVLIYARAAAGGGVAARQVSDACKFLQTHGVTIPMGAVEGVHQPELGVFVDTTSNLLPALKRPGFEAVARYCADHPQEDGACGWVVIDSPAHLARFRSELDRVDIEDELVRHYWVPLYLHPFGRSPVDPVRNSPY
jgi:hypothetical protein